MFISLVCIHPHRYIYILRHVYTAGKVTNLCLITGNYPFFSFQYLQKWEESLKGRLLLGDFLRVDVTVAFKRTDSSPWADRQTVWTDRGTVAPGQTDRQTVWTEKNISPCYCSFWHTCYCFRVNLTLQLLF